MRMTEAEFKRLSEDRFTIVLGHIRDERHMVILLESPPAKDNEDHDTFVRNVVEVSNNFSGYTLDTVFYEEDEVSYISRLIDCVELQYLGALSVYKDIDRRKGSAVLFNDEEREEWMKKTEEVLEDLVGRILSLMFTAENKGIAVRSDLAKEMYCDFKKWVAEVSPYTVLN